MAAIETPLPIRLRGVDSDGLPYADCDFKLKLVRDPDEIGAFIGSARVEVLNPPSRLIAAATAGTSKVRLPKKVRLPEIADEEFERDVESGL